MKAKRRDRWLEYAFIALITVAVAGSLYFAVRSSGVTRPAPRPSPVQSVDPDYHVTWDWDGIHCRDAAGHLAGTSHCIMPPEPGES